MNAYAAETVEVVKGEEHQAQPGVLSPDLTIVILTYVTFFILLAILYKFAWRPILSLLDQRENTIRQSLDDAKKAREELEQVKASTERLIAEADEKAKMVVERSRKAAVEAARTIEHKAQEEAQIMLNNASQEMKAMVQKARMSLRQESAGWAVDLAQKLLEDNLDPAKQQKLVDHFIKDFKPEQS